MGKKLPITPDGQITSALRLLSMRSRERAQALKNADRRCASCGQRHSTAKGKECQVQAHHARRPNWKRVRAVIREEVLQTPADYVPLCKKCHGDTHQKERKNVAL